MVKKNRISKCAATALTILSFVLTASVGARALDLVPVGRAVGIELSCDGVLVAGLAKVKSAEGECSPASDAGIAPGDIIVMVSGTKIGSAEDFLKIARDFTDAPVSVTLKRGEKLIQYTVTPAEDAEGARKLGLMLRDGVSGIGTVTFYDPATGLYGALGHAINDSDTGVLMPLGEGFITSASVADVKRGVSGTPGELHGAFDAEAKLGTILRNTGCGIFGRMDSAPEGVTTRAAASADIRTGPAVILAQVKGSATAEYDIEVSRVYRGGEEQLTLTVTDPELLALTGGIVQGMSGCPILQNGKLIGAVTHVLLSDPTRGYGVTISSMLSAAEGCLPSKSAA
ncbi:MAG: SpoIVB peptidase [Oscillospiraceae bacterium]